MPGPNSMNESPNRPTAEEDAPVERERNARLARLTHKIRTPVNAILGYCELLIEDSLDSGRDGFLSDLRRIQSAGRELFEVAKDALEERRTLEASARPVDEIEVRFGHLIRTPLNTILGYCEMLIEDAAILGAIEAVPDLERVRDASKLLQSRLTETGGLFRAGSSSAAEAGRSADDTTTFIRNVVTSIRPRGGQTEPRRGFLLIADDSPVNRDLLERRLTREGYTVDLADNGVRALEMIQGRDYEILLLDIMMPLMDGFEVLRKLRAQDETKHLPVIVISALDDVDSIVRCVEMGADDYLTKPFDPVLLRARIDASLERKRLRDREQSHLREISLERQKSESLLLNVLPRPIAERLKLGETTIADNFEAATVLFADLVGFTQISSRLEPSALVQRLNQVFSAFDLLAEKRGLEKIKTIGDSYMVASGIPTPRSDHAEVIAEMALEILQVIGNLAEQEKLEFQVRVGFHSGPVVAGVIGIRKFAFDLWGDTVNIASRMESQGLPGEIQVSAETYALLEDRYRFEERGRIAIKGKGRIRTYLLKGRMN